MSAVGTVRMHRPDAAPVDELQHCGRAILAVRRPSATCVSVAVIGDVDAVNARELGRYVADHTHLSRQLVLDLRGVDFFGTQAFTALCYISVFCIRSDVDWVIVGGPPVRRLLSICDPDGELPLVDDLSSGLIRLDHLAQCRYHMAPAG